MRLSLLFLSMLVAVTGCQSAPRPTPPPVAAPVPLSVPSLELQEKTLRQQQQIQALIAQNEALLARVRELETAPPVPPVPVPAVLPPAILQPVAAELVKLEPAPPPTPPAPIVPPPSAEPAILPNADGLIDLTALLIQTRDGDDVNPFAVRSLPADAIREVTLHVQGVIGGAAPCALINQRTVQPEQTIESLTLVGIEPNAVLVRHAGHLLRLPVAEKSVRIRLPL